MLQKSFLSYLIIVIGSSKIQSISIENKSNQISKQFIEDDQEILQEEENAQINNLAIIMVGAILIFALLFRRSIKTQNQNPRIAYPSNYKPITKRNPRLMEELKEISENSKRGDKNVSWLTFTMAYGIYEFTKEELKDLSKLFLSKNYISLENYLISNFVSKKLNIINYAETHNFQFIDLLGIGSSIGLKKEDSKNFCLTITAIILQINKELVDPEEFKTYLQPYCWDLQYQDSLSVNIRDCYLGYNDREIFFSKITLPLVNLLFEFGMDPNKSNTSISLLGYTLANGGSLGRVNKKVGEYKMVIGLLKKDGIKPVLDSINDVFFPVIDFFKKNNAELLYNKEKNIYRLELKQVYR